MSTRKLFVGFETEGRNPDRVSIDGRDIVYDAYGRSSQMPASAVAPD